MNGTGRIRGWWIAGLLVFLTVPPTVAEIPDPVGETYAQVSQAIQGTARAIIDDATEQGEYLIQQGAMEVLIATQNLDAVMTDQQDRAWQELDGSVKTAFRELRTELKSLERGMLNYQDFLVLDAGALLDRIPLLKGKPVLRSIEGGSQPYRTAGEYRFRLMGSIFRPNADLVVRIGGFPIPEGSWTTDRTHELRASVPAARLHQLFQDDKVALTPLVVEVYGSRKRGWLEKIWHNPFQGEERVLQATFRVPIRLLPKIAARYTLVELGTAEVAVGARWSDWGPRVRRGAVGRNCSKHASCAKRANICAPIPPNARVIMVKGHPDVKTNEGGKCDEFCEFVGRPEISQGKVCQEWRNWRKSHGGSARLRFRYEQLKPGISRVARQLSAVGSVLPASHLEFGRIYAAEFSADYASFDLVLTLFNGEEIVITPQAAERPDLVRVTIEKMPKGLQRLLLTFDLDA